MTLRVLNPFSQAEICRTNGSQNRIISYLRETYSQYGEDLMIAAALATRDVGVRANYIDIGANHPIEISNTYLLYRNYGACGVLFEADPERIEELNLVRPRDKIINAAISNSHDETAILHIANATECSSLRPELAEGIEGLEFPKKLTVPNLHVAAAFEQHWRDPVHLLSVDIEGMDFPVLQAIDWNKYRPWIVCVEVSPRAIRRELATFMGAQGYLAIGATHDNLVFMELRELLNK